MGAELPKKFWAAGIFLGEFICWYCAQQVDPNQPHDCPDKKRDEAILAARKAREGEGR